MALPQLAAGFKEFLRLLRSNGAEYLLTGGYAVCVYGHVRATNGLDVWVGTAPEDALKLERVLREFGFAAASSELFLAPERIVRMGVPPIPIEILTPISGVEFLSCYAEREEVHFEGIRVPVISLARLRENKAASGRAKDLAHLESLPKRPRSSSQHRFHHRTRNIGETEVAPLELKGQLGVIDAETV